jgi:hypothetical protein
MFPVNLSPDFDPLFCLIYTFYYFLVLPFPFTFPPVVFIGLVDRKFPFTEFTFSTFLTLSIRFAPKLAFDFTDFTDFTDYFTDFT